MSLRSVKISDYEKASSNAIPMTVTKWTNWKIQIERKRIPRQKDKKKIVKRRHCVSACISFLLTSLSKQSSWSQDVSAMSNKGRRKVWKSEGVWSLVIQIWNPCKPWQYLISLQCYFDLLSFDKFFCSM